MRIFKVISVKFFAALLALSLLTGPSALFAAASSSKQLAKGIELYNEQNYDDAMDYFIDVLVNGSRSEVDEANRYINLIHNHIGGIQDPVEVEEPAMIETAAQPEPKTQEISEVFVSPMKGEAKLITETPDPTFAQKMMGDGIVIFPEDGTVYAPCDATVQFVFDTPFYRKKGEKLCYQKNPRHM